MAGYYTKTQIINRRHFTKQKMNREKETISESFKALSKPYESVADFYANKSIFITGGTGFLGKALTEKLLYSCPNIRNVYLLVREKNNCSLEERYKEFFDSPMFQRLNKKCCEKIKFIYGDLTKSNLGMNSDNLNILQEEVYIVFHAAATVKFNVPLSVALKINVEGTEEVLKITQTMKKIQLFVYVSTAFSNATHERYVIEEKLYPPPKSLEEVYSMIKRNDDNAVFSSELLDGRPNTYTFSKALAEHVLNIKRGDLPTIIIRPSIVSPAVTEPVRGWIANWMGPSPMMYLVGKGWCRCVSGKPNHTFEIIPVDYIVNLTISAAAKYTWSDDIIVYHSCTSSSNPLTFKEASVYFENECRKQKFNDLPLFGVLFTMSPLIIQIMSFIFEVLPAYVADFFLIIMRKPTRFVTVQRKVAFAAKTSTFFRSKSWYMKTQKAQALYKSLSSSDQNTFPSDPVNINWNDYMATYLHGIRKYLLKDKTMNITKQ